MRLLSLLEAPLAVFSVVAFAVLLGLAAQRLLGIRLGPVRLLATGLFATAVLPVTGVALLGDPAQATALDPKVAFWFLLLAAMSTLLASMVFIVIVEALAPLGSIPPATVWGRGLRARWRRTRRTLQVVVLGLRHGLGPYLRGRRGLAGGTARVQLGHALCDTLAACGATFIKMGQVLSTRASALPQEVAAELASLRDNATPVPWEQVEPVLAEAFGAEPSTVLAEIDPVPLAAASIGQVHAARLHSGQRVVVKVQRPGVRPAVEQDLDIALRLATRLERTTTWGRSLGTRDLAEGLGTAMREELDYRIETENILAVARAHGAASMIRVPVPYPQLSTDRVLVMERLDGLPASCAGPLLEQDGIAPDEIARRILDMILRQIVVEGVFHADPHPGNIFVLPGGRIGLLDLGSVGRLDGVLRQRLGRLLLGFHLGDSLMMTDSLLEVAPPTERVDVDRLERDVGRILARTSTGFAVDGRSTALFGDLFALVAGHRLRVVPEVAAVFRALATVEGTIHVLAPGFDFLGTSRDIAGRYLVDQLSPNRLGRAAAEEIASLLPMLRRLPRRLDRILAGGQQGHPALAVHPFADHPDGTWFLRRLHDVLLTALAGVVGLMGALLTGLGGGPDVRDGVGLHALIGYNLLVVSGVLGVRVLAQVFRQAR